MSELKFRLTEEQIDLIKSHGPITEQARAVGLTPSDLYNALAGRKRLPMEITTKLLTLSVLTRRPAERNYDPRSIRAKLSRLKMEVAERQEQIKRIEENLGRLEALGLKI